MMRQATFFLPLLVVGGALLVIGTTFVGGAGFGVDSANKAHSDRMIEEGKQVFRYDTFGDEDFWGGQLRLHEAIERDMVQVRLMGPGRFVVAGAPSYLARRGTPQKPEDLLSHACIGIRTSSGARYAWELERGKRTWRIPVEGPVTSNGNSLRRQLALAGVGLIYTLEAQIAEDLEAKRLRLVLEPFAAEVPGFFLYFPSRAQVSPALRALVEFAREFKVKTSRQ